MGRENSFTRDRHQTGRPIIDAVGKRSDAVGKRSDVVGKRSDAVGKR